MFGVFGNTIDRQARLSGVQWRSVGRGRALGSARGRLVRRLVAAICLLIALVEPVASAIDKPSDYVGATACAPCHREIFEHWSKTGHAGILHRPGAIEARDIPLPLGLTANDISFVVGGFRWKALFLDRQGYLVTSNSAGPGANQFNLRGRHWVDFRPGEKVPYDCGRCHTTGYVAEGHQGGLPGIAGTWRLDGVQCESCHGPGARHAVSQRREDIVTRPERCPSCHRQKSPEGIPLVGGDFLAPYTERTSSRRVECGNSPAPYVTIPIAAAQGPSAVGATPATQRSPRPTKAA